MKVGFILSICFLVLNFDSFGASTLIVHEADKPLNRQIAALIMHEKGLLKRLETRMPQSKHAKLECATADFLIVSEVSEMRMCSPLIGDVAEDWMLPSLREAELKNEDFGEFVYIRQFRSGCDRLLKGLVTRVLFDKKNCKKMAEVFLGQPGEGFHPTRLLLPMDVLVPGLIWKA